MRKIKAQPLTVEAFAPFGTFTNVTAPQGDCLCGPTHKFYRDSARFYCDFTLPVGFSPIMVEKSSLKISALEYHNRTCEAILPMNDDAIVHVTAASGVEPCTENTKAFIVPKGTIISMFPGVWHLCPLPVKEAQLHALIILPERAYVNDFTIVDLKPEDIFEIEL